MAAANKNNFVWGTLWEKDLNFHMFRTQAVHHNYIFQDLTPLEKQN